MVSLKGEQIKLRALEPEDLEFVYSVENDETIWEISNTQTPYSKYLIKRYIENAHKDIYEVKQLRLVIANLKDNPIGLIDVYDFDFANKRAGIGILIKNERNRGKGYGSEALQLLVNYCFSHLHLHQLFCNISEENINSLNLFEKNGFEHIGLKKDWNLVNSTFKNEYLLQRINTDVH